MFRIFRPALILLASALLCVGLIATRPVPAQLGGSPYAAGQAQPAQLIPTLEVRPATPTPDIALSERPQGLTIWAGTEVEGPALKAEALRIRGPAAPAPRIEAAPQPAPAPAPARIPGDGPHMAGTLVAQTERLDLYVGRNTFSAQQVAELAPLIERLLRKNEARFGTTLDRRVSIAFYRTALAPSRGVRGLAFTDSGRAELYYRPYEDIGRAATIAAHELGHHLEVQRYGEAVQRRADTILHEGMATWIAGHRWLAMCDAPTWHERARQLRDAGVPLRLLTAERYGPDNAYELWASFVHFLTLRYGWEKLDALYVSSRGRAPGSANYQQVLGKSLDEVADEWRAWINDE
jgi:hypothetical protein